MTPDFSMGVGGWKSRGVGEKVTRGMRRERVT